MTGHGEQQDRDTKAKQETHQNKTRTQTDHDIQRDRAGVLGDSGRKGCVEVRGRQGATGNTTMRTRQEKGRTSRMSERRDGNGEQRKPEGRHHGGRGEEDGGSGMAHRWRRGDREKGRRKICPSPQEVVLCGDVDREGGREREVWPKIEEERVWR